MSSLCTDTHRPQRVRAMTVLATLIVLVTSATAAGQNRLTDQTVRNSFTPRFGRRLALPVEAAPGCELHGTCVSWAPDLETAENLARDQTKLLFVMHLSGNFTNPTFT